MTPHTVEIDLFGDERRTCNCYLCAYSRRVDNVIKSADTVMMTATINELMDANYNIGADLEYDEAVLDGSWPSAVEILERALEKAKVHPNRRLENDNNL